MKNTGVENAGPNRVGQVAGLENASITETASSQQVGSELLSWTLQLRMLSHVMRQINASHISYLATVECDTTVIIPCLYMYL